MIICHASKKGPSWPHPFVRYLIC